MEHPTSQATRGSPDPRAIHPSLTRPEDPLYRESDSLTSFNDFGLAEPITRALAQENYVTPTPI